MINNIQERLVTRISSFAVHACNGKNFRRVVLSANLCSESYLQMVYVYAGVKWTSGQDDVINKDVMKLEDLFNIEELRVSR